MRTMARIASERAAARPLIEKLRTSPALVWESELPAEWRNAGFAQELIDTAVATLESDPRQSLVFAQLALTVTTSIPPDSYPAPVQAQLEGSAWKEIGTVHRYRSEYGAALRAYDAARRTFDRENALAHDAAITEFARSIVLSDMGRHAEARRVIEEIVPILRSFGDQRRTVQAMMMTGIIEQRQGRLAEARTAYESALAEVPDDDLHTRAVLYLNLGQALGELGESNESMLMLHRARTLLTELQMPGEITRTDWALGRAMMRAGDFEGAVPILQRTRSDFHDRGMPEEAGLVGLDIVESLIALGSSAQARGVTEDVLSEFRAAQLNERAITALAYLRDLPEPSRSGRSVRHVRSYIEQLRLEPDRPFLPLPE